MWPICRVTYNALNRPKRVEIPLRTKQGYRKKVKAMLRSLTFSSACLSSPLNEWQML